MFKLIRFLKPFKKECIVGPLFKLFEAILELILPTIMALVINNGVLTGDKSYIIKMGIIMIIMTILGFSSSLVCQRYAAYASQGVGTNLRNALFEKISSFSYIELDKFGTPSLVNRITNDVNQLQLAVAMLIRLVVRAPFIFIGAIIMAMILDLKLSLVLIGTTPIFGLILYFFISKTAPLYKKYQKKLDSLALKLRETLGGVRVIRAFTSSKYEEVSFNEYNDDLTNSGIGIVRISSLLNPITSLVMNFTILILLWMGAIHINMGSMSSGTIIAFINYVTQILYAMTVVSNLIVLFTKAEASALRINEVLETEPSIVEKENPIYKDNIESDVIVEFKNVYFSYNNTGDSALSDINIKVNKGETIGIIGGTGSGKTTFINLIGRFYDVTSGEVLVKGVNVKDYPIKRLREIIGIVPQKLELFTGTIKENLAFGNKDASLDEIIEASKIAQAYEFISNLEEKFDTKVTRGGTNFSGGQKQRLAITRALVKKPEILILDDSSSALDFATDKELRKAIRENSKDTTVFIVSQRANSLMECDKIMVFDDGIVEAIGTHKELINNSKVYKEICLSQVSKEEV